MKQTINSTMFHDAFERMGRKENFSYEALELLFDYFNACEEEGNEIELDVIAICCDYQESTIDDHNLMLSCAVRQYVFMLDSYREE